MASRPVALHVTGVPAPRRPLAPRAGRLALELILAGAILAGGTVGVLLLSLLVLLTAPFAAALLIWIAWRSGDAAAREARRVRARIRRRARTLGLVVLAGSRPALLRLAAAGTRQPVAPRPVR
jgi:hypothetical protein